MSTSHTQRFGRPFGRAFVLLACLLTTRAMLFAETDSKIAALPEVAPISLSPLPSQGASLKQAITALLYDGSGKSVPAPAEARGTAYASLITDGARGSLLQDAAVYRAATAQTKVSREDIAASLMEFIEKTSPWDKENTDVEVEAPLEDIPVSAGELRLEWSVPPNYGYTGQGTFRVRFYVDGKFRRSLSCRATIQPYTDVVVATRDIPRAQPIGPDDVEKQKQPANAANKGVMVKYENVIGLVAANNIYANTPVTTRNTQMPTVVKRSQVVTVEMQAGSVSISTQAVAMNDARVGDKVRCASESTKEQYQGILRADGAVVVR